MFVVMEVVRTRGVRRQWGDQPLSLSPSALSTAAGPSGIDRSCRQSTLPPPLISVDIHLLRHHPSSSPLSIFFDIINLLRHPSSLLSIFFAIHLSRHPFLLSTSFSPVVILSLAISNLYLFRYYWPLTITDISRHHQPLSPPPASSLTAAISRHRGDWQIIAGISHLSPSG